MESNGYNWAVRLVMGISSGVLAYVALHFIGHPLYGQAGSIVIAACVVVFMFFFGGILRAASNFLDDLDFWPGNGPL